MDNETAIPATYGVLRLSADQKARFTDTERERFLQRLDAWLITTGFEALASTRQERLRRLDEVVRRAAGFGLTIEAAVVDFTEAYLRVGEYGLHNADLHAILTSGHHQLDRARKMKHAAQGSLKTG